MPLFAPKLTPLPGCTALPNALADWRAAARCGQYRLGSLAVYWPDGSYAPLAQAADPQLTTKTIATSGCCGLTLPNPAVTFLAGGQKRLLLADTPRQAQRLLQALGGEVSHV